MSTEFSARYRQAGVDAFRDAGHSDNVVPLRQGRNARQADEAPHRSDKLLAAISPLLDEVDGLRGNQAQHDTNNVGRLLEENTRLRKLAVKLSNLLGDLPKQSA